MDAGREIDALVAEKVMGLDVFEDQANYRGVGTIPHATTGRLGDLPHYSTDIAAAWQVLDKFDGYDLSKAWANEDRYGCALACELWYYDGRGAAGASTMPHAICLAALKAKGIEA